MRAEARLQAADIGAGRGTFWDIHGRRYIVSNSGTEANETAVKIAQLYRKAPKIISFWDSHHGSIGLTYPECDPRCAEFIAYTIEREGSGLRPSWPSPSSMRG